MGDATTTGSQDVPPRDYTLIVPGGWFQIDLDPEERDPAIMALAGQQFSGIDNAPLLRERLMRDLQRKAKKAYKEGGVEFYLSTLVIGGVPLPSSLLVNISLDEPWSKCSTAHELAALIGEVKSDDEGDVRVVALSAAGDAVRIWRKGSADPEKYMGSTLPTTTVIYRVPIPASTRWLSLTFSTPAEPLSRQMTELFDAVADTLQWS